MTEAQLHRAVADYLRVALKPPTLWTTFPAGGGGRVRGAQLKAMGLRAGWPDIIVMEREGEYTFVLGIELKTKNGKQSAAQKEVAESFLFVGGDYVVARSVEEVEAHLRARLIPLHATVTA